MDEEDSSIVIDDNPNEEGQEVSMNGNDVEIVVEDDDEEAEKETENDDVSKSDKRVFVKKKIPNDDEWFAQLSEKEMKYYKKHVLLEKELDESTVVCTACFRQVNHKHAGAVVRHPDLGVPICKQCKKFYHMGEWTRGEDGFFEYCRWCANGGDLLLCDSCSNAFCKKCIKRNLGRSKVTEIEEVEEWDCLACQPKQVWKQRSMYHSVWLYQKNMMATEQEKEIKMKKEAKTNFIEETLKDGFDVNKILGNYMDRAKKSWSRKSQDYTQDDLAKVVVKLRTIIKITHHNLELLDKNLVSGCRKSFPGINLGKLAASEIPDDGCQEVPEVEKAHRAKVKEETVDDSKNNFDESSLVEDVDVSVSANGEKDTNGLNAEVKMSTEANGEVEDMDEAPEMMEESESGPSKSKGKKANDVAGTGESKCLIEKPKDETEVDKEASEVKSAAADLDDSQETEKKTSKKNQASGEKSVDESQNAKSKVDDSVMSNNSNADVSKDMFSNSDNEEIIQKDDTSINDKSVDEKVKDTKNNSKIDQDNGGEDPEEKKASKNVKTDPKNSASTNDQDTTVEQMDTSNVADEVSESEEQKVPDEEDIDSEEANARARAAVLQTTSSESDQAKDAPTKDAPTDPDDTSPRKKLKTKKVLDQMRRKSGGEDGPPEKQGSSDEEKETPTTPKSKKKAKLSTSTPKPKHRSGSESGSGKDLMGIDSDDEDAPKAKKKMKKKKAANGHGSDESPKKKSKKKSGAKSSDNSVSGASGMDSDEKAYRKKQKKKAKRNQKVLFEELNIVAAKVDTETNEQLNKGVRVNIQYLDRDIKADLKELDEVDITSHPSLAKLATAKSDKDRDVDRLCDFKSLKKSRRASDESDSEDDEDKEKEKKEPRKREKKEKEAAKGLGDMSSDSNGEQHSHKEDSEEDNRPEGFKSQNDLAKAAVLATSSEDENAAGDASSDEEQKTPVKEKKEKAKKEKKPKKVCSDSDSDSSKPKRKNKPALLSMKLSETDSSEDEAKYRSKVEKRAAAAKEALENSDDSPDSSDVAQSSAKKKKLSAKKRKLMDSDSDASASEDSEEEEESEYQDSDSSVDKKKKKRNRKRKSSSSDDSDSDKPKKKRKRIKGGSESEEDNEDASPNKGRHEIRKILKEKHLTATSKEAAAEEKARRQRMEERQALYNKTFSLPESKKDGEGMTGQLVLDFDPETKDVLVEVDKKLVKRLKPHQVNGVKFMWDACYESIAQIKSGMEGGAILAHCMGLGKTLQTITLTHTLLDHKKVKVNRVMVICPVNTVKNWQDEYDKWLKGDLELDVFEMSAEKDNWGRADRINQWFREGGVLIIGYEMFRNLVSEKNSKFKKKQRETFNNCLLDPGPDLVICDEGHLLKNEKSAINKAVNRIKTHRRIVLTGTPLQNNLKEYFEMVNFVKPNLLGTRKEFMNRFVNPIVNGQHSDSTERDVRTMKKRSFILSDLLKGCMQRLDYNVLVPYLQPKQEYVISITLTDLQKKLYKYYLENYAKAGQIGADGKLEGGKKGGLFYDVQNLSRIWNHPCILLLAKQRKEEKEDADDEEGSLKDFICDEETGDSGNDDDSDIQELDSEGATVKKITTRSDKPDDLVEGLDNNTPIGGHKGWWNSFLDDGQKLDELKFGNKMVLLMDILKESALIGDKVLVFSQSLLSLDLIEDFLSRINDAHEVTDRTGDNAMADYLDTWIPGKDYYRMDGSTNAETRKIWCKFFNRTTSHRMRLFLISTKAGGLGINLVAANRVIIFDASWNPSHDVQSIFRVFRFGQTKPVYIYRFLAKGTMEEKIYDRQVTKQSLAARVVDEQQIERHFTMNELSELYEFNDEPLSARPVPVVPEDRLLAELVDKHKEIVWSINNHDSLLENQVDENLTEEERKAAWAEFENEKKGMMTQSNVGLENVQQFGQMLQKMLPTSGATMTNPMANINPMAIQAQLRQMNPELSHEELVARTRAAIMQLQNMHRTQTPVFNQNTINIGQRTGYDQSLYQAEMAKAKAMINQQYPGMYRFRGANPHAPNSNPMASVPNMMPNMSNMQSLLRRPTPSPSHAGEVITLDGGPETGPPPVARMPVRAGSPALRGGSARGGRRGRDDQSMLARLQQAGRTMSPASGSKPSSGNES